MAEDKSAEGMATGENRCVDFPMSPIAGELLARVMFAFGPVGELCSQRLVSDGN